MEFGVNSHMPSPPGETWARRYGDCKDKVVALVALLTEMGFEAFPALVNTEKKAYVSDHLPSQNLFDHVIVALFFKQQWYWLDPTRQYQSSNFQQVYQPDYGVALIVKSGQKHLTPTTSDQLVTHRKIAEHIRVYDDVAKPSEHTVLTTYLGRSAERQRARLASKSMKAVQRRYEDYYRKYYPETTSNGIFKVNDDIDQNTLQTDESYSIQKLWTDVKSKKKYEADFYLSNIEDALPLPEVTKRKDPFAWPHPIVIEHQLTLEFNDRGWNFDAIDIELDNRFFHLTKKVAFFASEQKLVINLVLRSKQKNISATDIDAYLTERQKAQEHFSYGVYQSYDESQKHEKNSGFIAGNITLIAISALALSFLLAIALWLVSECKLPEDHSYLYYPVSPIKFIAFSLLTFQVYDCYWFYKNWRRRQVSENSAIQPLWRAIFASLWYIPLVLRLRSDQQDGLPIIRAPIGIFVFLGAGYLILPSVVSWQGYPILGNTVSVLCLLPLILLVNRANHRSHHSAPRSAKIHFHSLLAAPALLAVAVATNGADLRLTPSTKALEGGKLASFHRKFLLRNKIVPSGESVRWFYSSALLDLKADGNGFTENTVFSYWHEAGQLNVVRSSMDEVIDITFTPDDGLWQDSVITIKTHNDEEFVLFVSNEDGQDHAFYADLKKQWQQATREDPEEDK